MIMSSKFDTIIHTSWNGLTNEWHPTQMLADFMTLKAEWGTLKGKTLTHLHVGLVFQHHYDHVL
jgi:ornithine carbamoyltransferase